MPSTKWPAEPEQPAPEKKHSLASYDVSTDPERTQEMINLAVATVLRKLGLSEVFISKVDIEAMKEFHIRYNELPDGGMYIALPKKGEPE